MECARVNMIFLHDIFRTNHRHPLLSQYIVQISMYIFIIYNCVTCRIPHYGKATLRRIQRKTQPIATAAGNLETSTETRHSDRVVSRWTIVRSRSHHLQLVRFSFYDCNKSTNYFVLDQLCLWLKCSHTSRLDIDVPDELWGKFIKEIYLRCMLWYSYVSHSFITCDTHMCT